jgi:hypothetical protein
MKKVIKRIVKPVFFVPIIFAVFISSYCTDDSSREEHSYHKYFETNKEKAHILLKEYYAQVFDCANYPAALSRPTLLDSTIINFTKLKNSYYIKALVKTNCGKKIYATLKCMPEFFEEYKKSKSNHAYLVASINQINEYSTTAEADSLEGKTKNICIENSVMLSGNCIAFAEIPEYSSIY